MITDGIILILIAFFLWRGISRGFVKSLIGPVAFLIATSAAYFYYNLTHNIPISLAIGLLGPLVLAWGFSIIFFLLCKSSGGGTSPNVLSRLCGGMITIVWGIFIIIPIVYLLGFMPPLLPAIKPAIADILSSRTYATSVVCAQNLHLAPEKKSKSKQTTEKPSSTTKDYEDGDALEEVRQDARMQALLNDPKVQKAVEEKNYAAMLSNPEIMKMAQDPEFVKKLLAAFQKVQTTKPPAQQ